MYWKQLTKDFLVGVAVGLAALVVIFWLIPEAEGAEEDLWIRTNLSCTLEAAQVIAEAADSEGNVGAEASYKIAMAGGACDRKYSTDTYPIGEVLSGPYTVKDTGQPFYIITYERNGVTHTAFAFVGGPHPNSNME